MEKIIFLFGILAYLSLQLTNQPSYSALPFVVIGKADVLSSLTTEPQDWVPYGVTFSKTLPTMASIQASVSLISFDSFTSNEFCFNSTIKSVTLTSMTVSAKIYGNSYFRQLSLHYMVISHSESVPYIFNRCFLTSELLGQKKTISYGKIDLSSTETNRFQTISFINGLKIYNNNQTAKFIKVESYLKNEQSLLYHTISTQGKSLVEWICVGTIVMDAKYRATFSTQNGLYKYGKAEINYDDSTLDWTQVPEFFGSADMMFFGLSSLRLGAGKQNSKLLFHSERATDFKKDAEVISFGGEISYFFIANHQCLDLATPYFNQHDELCYDICPTMTYSQDTPVKSCNPCHYSCLTCSGKQQNECLTCKTTDIRTLDSTQCSCNTGYVDVGVSMCEKCSKFIDNCLQCDQIDHCTVCDFGLLFDANLKQCVCPNNEYFVPQSQICVPYPGCQLTLNDGSFKCQTCNTQAYFTKDPKKQFCICQQYYELKQDKCVQKCGDGVNLQQNDLKTCDDGNNFNGDGCDSNCIIESGYGCTNDIKNISICSPFAKFTLKYLFTQRIPGENSAIIVIKVDPFIQTMNHTDFLFTINTTIPHQNIEASSIVEHSVIKIKIDYLATIEGQSHQMKIAFDKRKITTADKSINFESHGVNLQLTYDSNLQLRKILNIMSFILSGLVLLVFIILCCRQQKMAATQLLLSCQLVYFTIFSIGNNPAVDGLSGLKYLTGFNDVYGFGIDPNNYQLLYILSTKCFKQYMLNFNVMIIIQIVAFLMMFPFKLSIWRLQMKKQDILNYELQENVDQNDGEIRTVSQVRKRIYQAEIILKKYINRVYYPVSLICLLPSIFYFSIQAVTVSVNNKFYLHPALNLLASSVSLILSCGFLVFLHQQSSKNRPMFTFFRKAIFFPFYLIFMYFVAVFIYSMVIKNSFAFFALVAFQVGILVFRVMNKPYPRYGTIQAIDSLAKHAITIICMALLYTSKFFSQSAQILLISIPVLLLINLALTLARCFKSSCFKKRKKSTEMNLLAKQNNNQDQSQNDQDGDSEQQQSSEQNSIQATKNLRQKKQTQQNSQGGQLNQQSFIDILKSEKNDLVNNNPLNMPSDSQSNEDEDQLTKVKRRLRKDLRQKRGVINSQVHQLKGIKKSKSSNA